MEINSENLEVVLVTDCGSTTTKALLFEKTVDGWQQSFENCFFVFTLLAVMYYFFFSFKHKHGGVYLANSGRWLLMVCFGAFFGSTVMARLSLLVERLQFLLGPWLQSLRDVF